jgi:2-polyprenyl-6-methoxyphenol hydroxylase-like FAD-dependent oxidoreductase
MTESPVVVRGPATAEEVAAVLAALRRSDGRAALDRYERWRATRLAALNRSVSRPLR